MPPLPVSAPIYLTQQVTRYHRVGQVLLVAAAVAVTNNFGGAL